MKTRVKGIWATTRGRLAIGSVAAVSAAGVIFGGALPAQAANIAIALNFIQITAQGPLAWWGYDNPNSSASQRGPARRSLNRTFRAVGCWLAGDCRAAG